MIFIKRFGRVLGGTFSLGTSVYYNFAFGLKFFNAHAPFRFFFSFTPFMVVWVEFNSNVSKSMHAARDLTPLTSAFVSLETSLTL
jgi:hypothetical protein